MRALSLLFVAWACFLEPGSAAEPAAQLGALGRMPVKEITVFKDGHAFVAHEGAMPTGPAGNVRLDYLPAPVLGTFWAYSATKNAKLSGVVASQQRVLVSRTALTLRELLEGNVGAKALITESDTNHYDARITGFPTRSAEELERTSPPNSGEKLPEKGNLILLGTDDGVKAINVERIRDVTFKNGFQDSVGSEEFRNLLTLQLEWNGATPGKSAEVGLVYLQKGFRWIPSYKITIDGKGNAGMKLQATLINELTDLIDTSVNLVIGVPSFAFKDTLDPMALQQTAARLSHYFQGDARNGPLGGQMSNAIMSQAARMGDFQAGDAATEPATPPEIPEGAKNEDLFVFSLKHITLKKGERAVLPVMESSLAYRDLFTLDLPFAPPPEVRGNLNAEEQQELALLFSAPKAMHKIRLENKSNYPLTTAPALVIHDNRVLSQGLMTYTASGANSDLALTTAVDIQVKKSDVETSRTPNAAKHNGASFTRVNLTGKIMLTNHRADPVTLEVTRHVLGNAEEADHEGALEKINVFENGESAGVGARPPWWNWYGWPVWWNYFNGVSRITWTVTLEPGKNIELGYAWHYFWN